MKILYVASKYDYGKPERGFSYEHNNFYDTLVKMNDGANEVIYFPLEKLTEIGREATNKELLESVYREKPELVFFANSDDGIKKEVIKEITLKSGATTFNWFSDDHWKFDRYSRFWAPLFNWVATTDSKALKKYEKIGYKNAIHSQWACNHFLYKKMDLPKIYNVTFIGVPHGHRRKIIQKITNAGINVRCWGRGWPEGRVSQEEMIRIFCQSKINLNFTRGSGVLWKEIPLIFLSRRWNRSFQMNNPIYWPSYFKSILGTFRKQIKGRNFEIPGCGGFLLTDYADNLKDYYEIGKEVVVFKNLKDLIEKIKYYLSHDREREEIARLGYERTMRNHTFEKRFNEMFRIMGLDK